MLTCEICKCYVINCITSEFGRVGDIFTQQEAHQFILPYLTLTAHDVEGQLAVFCVPQNVVFRPLHVSDDAH